MEHEVNLAERLGYVSSELLCVYDGLNAEWEAVDNDGNRYLYLWADGGRETDWTITYFGARVAADAPSRDPETWKSGTWFEVVVHNEVEDTFERNEVAREDVPEDYWPGLV